MAKTVIQGFAKLYPDIEFFQNKDIINEIRPNVFNMFIDKIEEQFNLETK